MATIAEQQAQLQEMQARFDQLMTIHTGVVEQLDAAKVQLDMYRRHSKTLTSITTPKQSEERKPEIQIECSTPAHSTKYTNALWNASD
jgi:hypothetical protein